MLTEKTITFSDYELDTLINGIDVAVKQLNKLRSILLKNEYESPTGHWVESVNAMGDRINILIKIRSKLEKY